MSKFNEALGLISGGTPRKTQVHQLVTIPHKTFEQRLDLYRYIWRDGMVCVNKIKYATQARRPRKV
jgi:hypothetical protein